ncbi:MAG: diacylglycerol kinase family lipid kinase, partial [Phyllobacterium sp.]
VLPVPAVVDRGELGIYVAGRLTPAALLKLAFTVLAGSWRRNADVDEILAKTIELHFPHLRRNAKATIDGELVSLPRDVKIAIHAGELKVLVPAGDPGQDEQRG